MRNWFTMKVVEDDEEEDDKKKNPFAEIMIYDAIGKSMWDDNAVSAASFISALADLGEVGEIKLRINSPGGDVFDGVAIYNAIKNHKARVTAHVDGIAASAASLIAMAADKIVMPSNAFMLVHNASGFSMGNAEDMMAIAADLQRIDKSMTATYSARSGQTKSKVASLMKEDRLMDATEAKELGFTDEVTAPVKMAARFSMQLLPKAAADRLRAATGTEQGDPPPSAPEPEEPGKQPVVDPAPTPSPETRPGEPDPAPTPGTPNPKPAKDPANAPTTAEVVDLKQAKAQGIAEHQAYVASITDLCTLARAPDRVGAYVRANTSVEQVRKELLALQANEPALMSQHPLGTTSRAADAKTSWGKITDKINARLNK
jgi:ATP-dependent Clp endopeptidase proteolytic subunit ClpP